MSHLEFKNVSLNYHTLNGEVEALHDVNLEIAKEEFVSIVGQSGCGKSTLLSLVSGLLRPTKGEVLIEGVPVSGTSKGGLHAPAGLPL